MTVFVRVNRRVTSWATGAFAVGLSTLLAFAPTAVMAEGSESQVGVASMIDRFREEIPRLMEEQGVPGLAVAVVDRDQVLWSEGFGRLERSGDAPVSTETIFGVESMSKVFTATAVMIAVQEGLVDLDEPIVTYLPDFTVHSAFEKYPERQITLRMLLSHTAGFTQEAPVGNNFELDPGTFDSHVQSISDTWLRFPVGTGYAYSNLGIDLAGHILEQVCHGPFPEVMKEKVLDPIGMVHSTLDRQEIQSNKDRAIGHAPPHPQPPLDPMTAAGGLYASADDLASFLRFQLGDGTLDGRTVLEPDLMAEMRTVPAPHEGATMGYALGVDRTRWIAGQNTDLFNHSGGGFGFLSDLWWLPQLQLGIAVLTNSSDHTLQGSLTESILFDLVHQPVYAGRLADLPTQDWPTDPLASYQLPPDLAQQVDQARMEPVGDEFERWASYSGDYRVRTWGVIDPLAPSGRFYVDQGVPYVETTEQDTPGRETLTETAPGRFLSETGETFDLTGPVPIWRNIELIKASNGPAVWEWLALGLTAAAALTWLITAGVRVVRRRRDRHEVAPPHRAAQRAAGSLAFATSLLDIAAIALIVAIPGLVDSGFIGWLDFPLVQRLALHLPLAIVMLMVALLGLGTIGWIRGWWVGNVRWQNVWLLLATTLLVALLASWGLVGWGWT
jgi:CubicO group peptidase (beta-lactamase class C family)